MLKHIVYKIYTRRACSDLLTQLLKSQSVCTESKTVTVFIIVCI